MLTKIYSIHKVILLTFSNLHILYFYEGEVRLVKKYILEKAVAKTAELSAKQNVNSACGWLFHQPMIPYQKYNP